MRKKFWIYIYWNKALVIVWLNGQKFRSSRPEVFLGKGVLKIYSKFTGEHQRWSAISIKLQSNFIKIALWHGCSPVNLLHVFRTPFPKNTSGRLLLKIADGRKIKVRHFIESKKLYHQLQPSYTLSLCLYGFPLW